jgi:DNA-binding FadR family transcriptional regulator
VAEVVHGIREMIRGESLRPGDLLPAEGAIAAQFDVSRVVIREAYRSLSALGIIDVGNGRRARVKPVDPEVLAVVIDHGVQTDQVSVQQILDVRRTIELRTVGLAAILRTPKEARAIADLAQAMRADFDRPDQVMEHDIAFHEAIARASRNPMFALVVSSFHVVTRQTWRIGWMARPSDANRFESIACHERIASAITAGNRQGAEALMGEHFDNTVRMLHSSGIN